MSDDELDEQCTIEEYHNDTEWINHSLLEYAGEWYRGEFTPTPDKFRDYADGLTYAKTTRSQEIGTVMHAVLEGKSINDVILIGPGENKQLKAWKDWKKSLGENEKRPLLKASEAKSIMKMYDNVMAHPQARSLIDQKGEVEKTIKVIDPNFGLKLKSRIDLMLWDSMSFVDYKSTEDPSPSNWLRHAYNLGVLRQAAFYRTVLSHKCGGDKYDPYHIVVGSKPPHRVCVYRFDESDLQEAYVQNHVMLKHVMTWTDYDMWEPDWATSIVCQRVPQYRGGY